MKLQKVKINLSEVGLELTKKFMSNINTNIGKFNLYLIFIILYNIILLEILL